MLNGEAANTNFVVFGLTGWTQNCNLSHLRLWFDRMNSKLQSITLEALVWSDELKTAIYHTWGFGFTGWTQNCNLSHLRRCTTNAVYLERANYKMWYIYKDEWLWKWGNGQVRCAELTHNVIVNNITNVWINHDGPMMIGHCEAHQVTKIWHCSCICCPLYLCLTFFYFCWRW